MMIYSCALSVFSALGLLASSFLLASGLWKEGLVLFLVSGLGIIALGAISSRRDFRKRQILQDAEIEKHEEGKRLVSGWNQVMADVEAGMRNLNGSEGRPGLPERVEALFRDIDALCQKGVLSDPEAALLMLDLNPVSQEISTAFARTQRPDAEFVKCYRMESLPRVGGTFRSLDRRLEALESLETRLEILEKLEEKTLAPGVRRKIFEAVENDVDLLCEENDSQPVSKVEKERSEKTMERIRSILKRLQTP